DLSAGILDPTATLSHHYELSSRWTLESSIAALLPVSEVSQEQGLTTTVTFASGPVYRKGRWTYTAQGSYALSMYNRPAEAHEEHEEEEAATTQGFGLDDDHGAEEEHEHEEEGEDRAYSRMGGIGNIGYRFTKNLSSTHGGGLSL